MSTIVPPVKTIWAEFNKNTMRATGQYQFLPPGQLVSTVQDTVWLQLDYMTALA